LQKSVRNTQHQTVHKQTCNTKGTAEMKLLHATGYKQDKWYKSTKSNVFYTVL